ncbi:uncharacterized protein K452DRAFT_286692 [Aplosporella prunicola CBS 121167]|uniref:Uncharacterized protein n=1 Tax=Aplosporella prunicola CBS 121167 TaxID=1176127 RepID=A0A6A6BHY8_9PEZI|nr:uncharacterized protein K452DRAFT_286692 [Aplosporella prunicola CBS 121167]KAF2143063.1 hypothetical protein K452DRAFT_286692 [Aplosporella prunicola CBS 121167]
MSRAWAATLWPMTPPSPRGWRLLARKSACAVTVAPTAQAPRAIASLGASGTRPRNINPSF